MNKIHQLTQSALLSSLLLSAMPFAFAADDTEVFGGKISGNMTFASD